MHVCQREKELMHPQVRKFYHMVMQDRTSQPMAVHNCTFALPLTIIDTFNLRLMIHGIPIFELQSYLSPLQP